MKYEIINPHDEAYMEADDHETAVVAIILVGNGGYGLKEIDGDFECPVLALFSGWVQETFRQSPQELYDNMDMGALKKALESFHVKGERSSITDFVRSAHEMAGQIEGG